MALVYYPPVNTPLVDASGNVTVPWRNYFQTLSGGITPGGGPGITVLSGDVTTAAGGGPQAATIANNAVTFAKMQDMNPSTLLGRGAGGGVGDPQEITLGAGLSMAGTVLSSSGTGGASGQSVTWLGDEYGDTYYQMLAGTSATASGAVCSPLTDGDPTQPELIFASGDVVMVCA